MTYDLPAMIAQAKVKPRPFRRITPTEALRASIAAPYFELIRAWRVERAALLAAYAAALPERGQAPADDAAATVQEQTDRSALRIAAILAVPLNRIPRAVDQMEAWHRRQWLNRIKAATTLDVAALTGRTEALAEMRNASVRLEQFGRALQGDIHARVGSSLVNSLQAREPASAVGTKLSDIFDAAKGRAARAALDQTEKLSGGMDRARRVAAGLTRFRWRHYNQQRHPRPEHVIRDMRIYTEAKAPNDRAGTLPFCQCWEEPLWD